MIDALFRARSRATGGPMDRTVTTRRRGLARLFTTALVAVTVGAHAVIATTFMSVEPIPTADVVGQAALDAIESAGYSNLERWANLLLDCGIVQDVIDELDADQAITTVTGTNTQFRVAAGGFEAVTHPSYVFTVRDTGPGAVSEEDVNVLDNALGYVLNQGGTAHFSPDNRKAYAFALDYAVVTFDGTLAGLEAKAFFDYLGTIDAALWSGPLAGFTQIDFEGSPTNNSMLFLQPAAPKHRFITGLFAAADTTPGATYVTLAKNGKPTTAKAGIAFPGNDWIAFPGGDQYLANLGTPSQTLLNHLAALRQQHLEAVASLVAAIQAGNLQPYLNGQFTCPGQ
jgi:hypothetical protein